MNSARSVGRTLGLLLLVQLAGLIVPFIMLKVLYAPPGFLQSAAQGTSQIRWALFLLLANGALATGISVVVHPALRPSGRGVAQWLIVLGAAWLVLQAVDNTQVMAMLTLSQRYAESAATPREWLDIIGPVASATRRTAHYTVLLAIGAWMLVFYGALWRSRLVPTIIPAGGLLAAMLHLGGVSLPVLLGYPSVMALAPLLAVSHGALILWLLAKGFPEQGPA